MTASARVRTTHGRGRLYDSVLDTVGDTPCIRVNNIAPKHVRMYVKVEAFNPASSVKDRLALNIIESSERNGTLKPGQTRGGSDERQHRNRPCDGVRAKGLPPRRHDGRQLLDRATPAHAHAAAPRSFSPRARQRASACIRRPWSWPNANGWFLARQFETDANAEIHESTTAREIMADFEGDRLDYFVTGYGTGGTVTGVARVLRRERPETKIVLTEPANAQLLGSGMAQQRKPTARPAPATARSSPIRSRAGRPISSRWCCRNRSTSPTTTK